MRMSSRDYFEQIQSVRLCPSCFIGFHGDWEAFSQKVIFQMVLQFEGAEQFRSRLAFAVLTNQPVNIVKIRELDEVPGVNEAEVCFAELIDKITNGMSITINSTGTTVSVTRAGYVLGGSIEHHCVGRSLGYFIEGVLPLCLFAKEPVTLALTGVTNDDVDISVDIIKHVTLKVVELFGAELVPQLDIIQRGLRPGGKGKVILRCPVVRELRAIELIDPGYIGKVRGVAYSVRVSPQLTNRMAVSSRSVFNKLLPDVFISTDHVKGSQLKHDDGLGSAPGFGLTVYAESTTGCVYGSQRAAIRQSLSDEGQKQISKKLDGSQPSHLNVESLSEPEAIGDNVAFQVLEQISAGGCVDSMHAPLVFTLMCLCPEDVSKVRVGSLSPRAVKHLRLLKDFFGVMFKLKIDESNKTTLCSCVGVGYKNLSRRVT